MSDGFFFQEECDLKEEEAFFKVRMFTQLKLFSDVSSLSLFTVVCCYIIILLYIRADLPVLL